MKERPILFSGPMVRALLDGTKTQTRRVVKPQPSEHHWQMLPGYELKRTEALLSNGRAGVRFYHAIPQNPTWDSERWISCPYGQPGDRLWVRETFVSGWDLGPDGIVDQFDADGNEKPQRVFYRASSPDLEWCDGGDDCPMPVPWKPSIHMPRNLSRITLEITSVRVERLQDISEADAQAEGCALECMTPTGDDSGSAIYGPGGYRALWESINGRGSWDANPWCWVVEFKRSQP